MASTLKKGNLFLDSEFTNGSLPVDQISTFASHHLSQITNAWYTMGRECKSVAVKTVVHNVLSEMWRCALWLAYGES